MDANELLEDLEKAGVTEELQQQFVDEMRKAGWGPDLRNRGWLWDRGPGGHYIAPASYRVLLAQLRSSVQGRIQELMLGELVASGDEAIPPQYQELVDRFYQVLASEGKQSRQATP
jgi:hypothetical protein